MDRLIINRRIEKLREGLQMTQTEFAKKLSEHSGRKYTRSDVNNWDAGGYHIKADTVMNIAACFGVSADYLLGLSEVPSVTPDMTAAAKFTGLSEEAVAFLHSLAPSSYEGNNEYSAFMRNRLNDVLSFCLSDPDFYYYILEPFGEVLELIKKSDPMVTTGILSEEELSLLVRIGEKGFYLKPAYEAIEPAIAKAANGTSKYWNSVRLLKELPEAKEKVKAASDLFLQTYGVGEE